MKPTKKLEIADGLDFSVVLCQYDNGDDNPEGKFYQLHIDHDSDTGVSHKIVFPIDSFDPESIGAQLIRMIE